MAFLALVAVALLPAAASAETFCVNDPGCSGTSKATITDAFTAAKANGPAKDRVQVGPGVYQGPFSNTSFEANPVELDGAGQGATTLTKPDSSLADVLTLNDVAAATTSTVTDLAVVFAQQGSGLSLAGGAAERVTVTGSNITTAFPGRGVSVFAGGTLRGARVSVSAAAGGLATGVDSSGATVEDTLVRVAGSNARGRQWVVDR